MSLAGRWESVPATQRSTLAHPEATFRTPALPRGSSHFSTSPRARSAFARGTTSPSLETIAVTSGLPGPANSSALMLSPPPPGGPSPADMAHTAPNKNDGKHKNGQETLGGFPFIYGSSHFCPDYRF